MLMYELTKRFKGMKFGDAWKDETFQDLYFDCGVILLSNESDCFDSFDNIVYKYSDLLHNSDDMKNSVLRDVLDTIEILEIRINNGRFGFEFQIVIDCSYDEFVHIIDNYFKINYMI